jgi:hypothetical protein
MVKFCAKCKKGINEDKDKFCMIIGKKNGKIFEFECFHYECWKSFFAKSVMVKVGEIFGKRTP